MAGEQAQQLAGDVAGAAEHDRGDARRHSRGRPRHLGAEPEALEDEVAERRAARSAR